MDGKMMSTPGPSHYHFSFTSSRVVFLQYPYCPVYEVFQIHFSRVDKKMISSGRAYYPASAIVLAYSLEPSFTKG